MKVVSPKVMQEWERRVMEAGVSVSDLMTEAVEGCLEVFSEVVGEEPVLPVVIVAGKGNNGNDAIEMGYRLREAGWEVSLLLTHSVEDRVPPPYSHLDDFISEACVWPDVPEELEGERKIVVDGVMGLGAKGPVKGRARDVLEWCGRVRLAGDVYVSLDSPSGVDPETGVCDEVAFEADVTCAIAAVKQGCLRDSARRCVGRIRCVDLEILNPPDERAVAHVFGWEEASGLYRRVGAGAHKHSRGRVGIWAGSEGMLGAGMLAAKSALRAGAGFVKLYVPKESVGFVSVACPEVVTRSLNDDGSLPEDFFECHACVIGPGLGRIRETGSVLEEVLGRLEAPVVLDADALYFLGEKPGLFQQLRVPYVLTPHVGEMKMLTGRDVQDRWCVAELWIGKEGSDGVLVLKGPNTLVAGRGEKVSFNASGNPGMATAGSGDVLAGMIGGLLSQGYRPWDAARLGVFWHGAAADIAVETVSEQCLIASDIWGGMSKALKAFSMVGPA